MRFASLGSGSEGNALVVQQANTCLMMDCGFSQKETLARLARLELKPQDLTAIVITHEHDDHASGAFKLALQHAIPIWLTYGTQLMSQRYLPNNSQNLKLNIIDPQTAFAIADIMVQPYSVPHDAREPVQFVFTDGVKKLGVLTDVGKSTLHITQTLSGCHALVLECNHDATMMAQGPYSYSLKERISSDWGHLENQAASELLKSLDNQHLQHIVAAHLSLINNTPELARQALANALNCAPSWVDVASQELGFGWKDL